MDTSISVIIPTHDRAALLARTVDALFAGSGPDVPAWEVIVVDDGSTDGTGALLERLRARHDERLRVVRQPNLRAAAARNRGLALARGRLLVLLGDDIIPGPGFLATHWRRFVTDGGPGRYAAIGRTSFHPEIGDTPFRAWINERGAQFGFSLIDDPDDVPFWFFYTSNLAFSRDLYDEHGGFHEAFQDSAWEDIELGYRYQRRAAMRLRYVARAAAHHHHFHDVRSFCRRQQRVGAAAVVFSRLHPELGEALGTAGAARPGLWARLRPAAALAAAVLDALDARGIDTRRWAQPLLDYHYRLGVAEGHGAA